MSLRYQINLGILIVLIIILVTGAFAAIWQARSSVSLEVSSSMNLILQLIKLGEAGGKEKPNHSSLWLQKIVSLEQTRHVQIQLNEPSGALVQIKSASASQKKPTPPAWFIWAVSGTYPSMTYHLSSDQKQGGSIIISADPYDEIMESWHETRSFFWMMLLLGSGLFLGVNLVFRQALNSVGLILHGLDALEHERYQNRLPSFATLEFDRIAGAINHLTETLEKARQDNNSLTLHSLNIQEEERRHLAQELHDELGQSLTAIKVMAVTADKPNADGHAIHESIIAVCDHLFHIVRAMMKSLHPLMLEELGLKASLEELVSNWSIRHPDIHFVLNCPHEIDELEPKIAIQLFRVVQECMTNTVRHAIAKTMRIEAQFEKERSFRVLNLEVRDDGVGCDPAKFRGGFGLRGIKARINSLDGSVEFSPVESRGMTIRVKIPVEG